MKKKRRGRVLLAAVILMLLASCRITDVSEGERKELSYAIVKPGDFPPDLGRALRRKHAMHATRVRLRRLLSALIAEREDSQLLYIPHGEPGMRRMIAALLALRPPVENDPLEEQIRWFQADQPESASPMSVPESSARSAPR